MADRVLTDGEKDLVKLVFGNAIDLSAAKISDDTLLPGRAVTPIGTANMGPFYVADYSHSDFALRSLFIHEMVHVYQYQSTGIPLLFSISADYDFRDKLYNEVPFSEWTIEEQADYVQEVYLRSTGQFRDEYSTVSDDELDSVDDGGLAVLQASGLYCFAAATPITLADGTHTVIEHIRIGDHVLAFDAAGQLHPARVFRSQPASDHSEISVG
jgi:hypothetical protein